MTMTLSPVSRWGVNTGLCLPRMIRATSVARRPRTMPSASTTNHLCSTSAGRAEYVAIELRNLLGGPLGPRYELRLTGAGCNPGLGSPVGRFCTDIQARQQVTLRQR